LSNHLGFVSKVTICLCRVSEKNYSDLSVLCLYVASVLLLLKSKFRAIIFSCLRAGSFTVSESCVHAGCPTQRALDAVDSVRFTSIFLALSFFCSQAESTPAQYPLLDKKNSRVVKMKPIEIKITGHIQRSSREICMELLDTERWSEFKGYSILPGIEHAHFETKTPELIGSRIAVKNTDGSSHIEEIIEWDVDRKVALRFQEFKSPLQYFATHFVEAWEFRTSTDGTEVSRTMTMYPKGILGWFMLIPISRLMKKAFERNL
jgi:hypothetical protein